jgi:hypothetical protein
MRHHEVLKSVDLISEVSCEGDRAKRGARPPLAGFLYAKRFDDIRGAEVAPGAKLRSDAEIECFVRRTASTTWHPVGTCKMGVDEMAVVDPCLRVRGIDGLRVVDASVMPKIVSGNTLCPHDHDAEREEPATLSLQMLQRCSAQPARMRVSQSPNPKTCLVGDGLSPKSSRK